MGLRELGITKDHVLSAMDQMRGFSFEGDYRSKKVFVIDPRNPAEVWDLKALVRLVAFLQGVTLKSGFVTNTYKKDFPKLGFEYIKFEKSRFRKLGLNGYDPEEFCDSHVVIGPNGKRDNAYLNELPKR